MAYMTPVFSEVDVSCLYLERVLLIVCLEEKANLTGKFLYDLSISLLSLGINDRARVFLVTEVSLLDCGRL